MMSEDNTKSKITYKDAGVDTQEGERAVSLMKEHVKKTFGPEVLTGIGGFGSLFKPDLSGIKSPVLVAGSDGVGTKLKIAMMTDIHDTVGIDLVAMCVNDVICQGARPLFFLDYIATASVKAEKIAKIVKGVADGCALAGCALVGGETAEMPGFYAKDDYDMAGFAVGMVDENRIITGENISEGDILIGLASSGLHSNGFSLVRKVLFDFADYNVNSILNGFDKPIGEVILTPTRIYVKSISELLKTVSPHALIHITGGGFYENIPRVIPEGLTAEIDAAAWEYPQIFKTIIDLSGMDAGDAFHTLNMGIGMIAVVAAEENERALAALRATGESATVIGKIVKGDELKITTQQYQL
jgi:phosphoribosylformylglycinamidine cyclo-ligase